LRQNHSKKNIAACGPAPILLMTHEPTKFPLKTAELDHARARDVKLRIAADTAAATVNRGGKSSLSSNRLGSQAASSAS